MVSFRSKNFIAVLLGKPVIPPNLNLVAISYIPTAAFFEEIDSMMYTSPSETRSVANSRL
jgi:hypothetical protein